MTTYLYGRSWHESGRFPVDEMSEEQARKAFADGPQVAVVAGEAMAHGHVPSYVLTMSAEAADVGVQHFAGTGSIEAVQHWEVVDGRLFLAGVVEYLYPDDGEYHFQDESTAVRTYLFKPDGYARLRTRIKDAGPALVEEFSDVDVSTHWHDRITWGEWDGIGTYVAAAPPRTLEG